ncbi:hypothetical protein KO561_07370 [Radiobacillus kanasensis]|uniref:hypothetical protein n=1 Tax=Radiobacillus kanasensis TaxID=2844358 RepID=UPI001E576E70|nr:hypothetical protein [Radiobacillus kanasensis]UFU00746.1 hypothetical protein KO561_07370 [Radiobacillus kanasensis]
MIHKGNFHKKKISLAKIKKVVEIKENIIINTGSVYDEEMIYGEWLSDENVASLKNALSDALQSKAVPFITESARTEDGS